MTPRSIALSIRLYDGLLRCYPPHDWQRFHGEMRQVFSLLIHDRYQENGLPGVVTLWLPLLFDWGWTVVNQWIDHLGRERKNCMTTPLDHQLGDMVWSITTGLYAAYDLIQVFEAISKEAPEPASSAAKQFLEEIHRGGDVKTALNRMREAFPSPHIDRLVNSILENDNTGVNLADALEPLSEAFISECGTDPAFYEFMRAEARALGAAVPERAKLPE